MKPKPEEHEPELKHKNCILEEFITEGSHQI